jgi:putative tryptophan/tyrosine transport system ATP-binding protein
MITLDNINVFFNKGTPLQHKALDSLSLKIAEGEFIVVIGGNGAGKSTLMNILAGEIIADSGKILFDNIDVTAQPSYIRASLISRVFQDPMIGTCSALTIEENFALCDMRGKRRVLTKALNNENKKKYKDLVAGLNLGLESRMQEPIGLLSGGQRQVLSLLMATLQPTKLLLLDEHTAALDPKMAQFVIEMTDNIIKEYNITSLMITHDMNHAAKYGSRTIVMQNGAIVHDLQEEEKKKLNPVELWNETQGIFNKKI